MPVGRVDRYLELALGSVLAKDGPTIELIIGFDGVVPPSLPALKDSRVSVLHFPVRRGVSKTLNDLIAQASYPLVARMDADDVSLPGRLARQVQAFADDPNLSILGGAGSYIDEFDKITGHFLPPLDCGSIVKRLVRTNCIVHPSVMMRRDHVLTVGGYDPQAEGVEDYELWLRMLAAGYSAKNLQDRILLYRRHSGQVTAGKKVSWRNERMLAARKRVLARAANMSASRVLLTHWHYAIGRRVRAALYGTRA